MNAGTGLLASEPYGTALLLAILGVLLLASTLSTRPSARLGMPVVFVFLAVGMAAGAAATAWGLLEPTALRDFQLAFRLGIIALVVILFDGGLNTPLRLVRSVAAPAGVLATVGVVGTMLVLATIARLAGIAWPLALVLGAVVSSTDAAVVFSVLRASGLSLKRRIASTLEVESGANDPMAMILTTLLTENLVNPIAATEWWSIGLSVVVQIVVGLIVGVVVAVLGGAMLRRLRLPAGGLYPVFTIALAFVAFGAATLLEGSGFLAVYVCGMVIGNGRIPFRTSVLRVHDATAWLGQTLMFLVLGILVTPARLLDVAALGLALGLILAVVARPVVVALCLAPFRFPPREVAYVGSIGLRGAVPIVLATFPMLNGVSGADWIFHVVFFIVVVNAIIPGSIVPFMTRVLRVEGAEPPRSPAVLAIESRGDLKGELLSFYMDEALPVVGSMIIDLPFPAGSAVTMIVRGQELIAPKGHTVLQAGDHVYVLTQPEDADLIYLMFGRHQGD